MGGAVALLIILLNIPITLRAIASFRTLAANESADHLIGHYSSWRLSRYTGRVLASNTYTTTSGSSIVRQGTNTGGVAYGPGQTYTRVHNNFRLRTADGQEVPIQVVDFHADVNPSDVVSVWFAQKHNKGQTLAVLNSTTKRQYLSDKTLYKITDWAQIRVILEIVVACFTCIGVIPAVIYVFGGKRQREQFKQTGIAPLWNMTAADARALLNEPSIAIVGSDQTGALTDPGAPPPQNPSNVPAPPAPPSPTIPAGWYSDPAARHEHRFWDGARWTEHVSDAGVPSTDGLPT